MPVERMLLEEPSGVADPEATPLEHLSSINKYILKYWKDCSILQDQMDMRERIAGMYKMSGLEIDRGGRQRRQERQDDPLITLSLEARKSQHTELDQLAAAVHPSLAA